MIPLLPPQQIPLWRNLALMGFAIGVVGAICFMGLRFFFGMNFADLRLETGLTEPLALSPATPDEYPRLFVMTLLFFMPTFILGPLFIMMGSGVILVRRPLMRQLLNLIAHTMFIIGILMGVFFAYNQIFAADTHEQQRFLRLLMLTFTFYKLLMSNAISLLGWEFISNRVLPSALGWLMFSAGWLGVFINIITLNPTLPPFWIVLPLFISASCMMILCSYMLLVAQTNRAFRLNPTSDSIAPKTQP